MCAIVCNGCQFVVRCRPWAPSNINESQSQTNLVSHIDSEKACIDKREAWPCIHNSHRLHACHTVRMPLQSPMSQAVTIIDDVMQR